jgi:hypothetical protein
LICDLPLSLPTKTNTKSITTTQLQTKTNTNKTNHATQINNKQNPRRSTTQGQLKTKTQIQLFSSIQKPKTHTQDFISDISLKGRNSEILGADVNKCRHDIAPMSA